MTRQTALPFAAYLVLGVFLMGRSARAARGDWNAGRALVPFERGDWPEALQPTLARTSCGFSINGRW